MSKGFSVLISQMNPLKLHEKPETVPPEGVNRVHTNSRLKLLALDTRSTAATKDVLDVTRIGNIAKAHQLRSIAPSVGVINSVTADVSDNALEATVQAIGLVQQVRRVGTSEIVKLFFSTPTTPEHVFIEYTRFPASPYNKNPHRCTKCFRLVMSRHMTISAS